MSQHLGTGPRARVPSHIPNVRASRGDVQRAAAPKTGKYAKIPDRDLEDARRIARYGEPGGWVGAMFYALHFWFRRRALRRELKQARQERAHAVERREAAMHELGRLLHQKNGRIDLRRVQFHLEKVEQTALQLETTSQGVLALVKRDQLKKSLAEQHRQLAEAAVDRGIARDEPQGWGKLQLAERALNSAKRTEQLTELGIDLYDAVWVKRGATLFWLSIAALVAAGVYGLATTRM